MKPITFRITAEQFSTLHAHLFPGDGDEHGAVLLAGISETERETRFLVREVLLAKDGADYVPGKFGYRMLTADFVARASHKCAQQKLCYFAVHCHGGTDSVGFSAVDLESHKRGYPALIDITNGGPVGALVFAINAVAGEIWTRHGTAALTGMTVVGLNHRRLFPEPIPRRNGCAATFDRQALIFGEIGQQHLAQAKVGIIGLGGVGSLINELVARLGVGEIVAIDYDRIESSNRSRVVDSTPWDALEWLSNSRWRWLRRLAGRWSRRKVRIAERVACKANPKVRFHALPNDVTSLQVAQQLADADFLFLCADSMQSRLVFNALVHQYLIPGIQIGSKVPVDAEGRVGNIFSVERLVLPDSGGGCLLCNQLIVASKLQEEALSPAERERQAYVKGVKAPSVITLNALGSSQAANDFLFSFLGLFNASLASAGYRMHFARERKWKAVDVESEETCLHCSGSPRSAFARGDRHSLPCKAK